MRQDRRHNPIRRHAPRRAPRRRGGGLRRADPPHVASLGRDCGRRRSVSPARPSWIRGASGPPRQFHSPPRASSCPPRPPLVDPRCVRTAIAIPSVTARLDREGHVIKLKYRGLAPRGTFVRGGRPKGRPYGARARRLVGWQEGWCRGPDLPACSRGAGGPYRASSAATCGGFAAAHGRPYGTGGTS
jgi:hypothetical protein